VVTGIIGIDGVHGGYTESHPVFAIALDVSEFVDEDQQKNWSLAQSWVYLLRTKGNGGGCSEHYYQWIEPNNTYYIQLPWPKGATGVKATAPLSWLWQGGAEPQVWIMGSQDPGWTLIKIQFPTSGYPGIDGQFTLVYSFPPGYQPSILRYGDSLNGSPSSPGPSEKLNFPQREKEDEFNAAVVASRIADPEVKAKFMADAQLALKRFTVQPPGTPGKAIPMAFDTPLKVEPRTPRPASEGQITTVQISPDPSNQQVHEAIKKLMDTYRPHMQPASPVNK